MRNVNGFMPQHQSTGNNEICTQQIPRIVFNNLFKSLGCLSEQKSKIDLVPGKYILSVV